MAFTSHSGAELAILDKTCSTAGLILLFDSGGCPTDSKYSFCLSVNWLPKKSLRLR